MNKVILIGRFTRDPESRTSAGGLEVSRFSLACSGDRANKNGERETEFINCVAFGMTANLINRFCKKGNLVSTVGRIRNGSYDAQDGSKRYTTDIVVDQIEFLSSKTNGSSNGGNMDFQNNQPSFASVEEPVNIETTNLAEDPYKDFGEEITLTSDDLPF